jgi:hypothetical protein
MTTENKKNYLFFLLDEGNIGDFREGFTILSTEDKQDFLEFANKQTNTKLNPNKIMVDFFIETRSNLIQIITHEYPQLLQYILTP